MSFYWSFLTLPLATAALTAEAVNSLSSCTQSNPSQRERNLLVKSASNPLAWERRKEGSGFRSSFRAEQIKCCLDCGLLVLPKDALSAAFTHLRLLLETTIK